MKRILIIFLLFLCAYSWCDAQQKDNFHEKEMRKSVEKFYRWYLYAVKREGDTYGIEVRKDDEGKVLASAAAYLENLRSMGFISKEFIRKEQKRLQPCINRLSGLDFKKYWHAKEHAFQPECDCMYYPIYLGTTASDLIGGIEVKKVLRVEDRYIVVFEFYAEANNGEYFSPGITGKAYFAREKNAYLLVDLTVGN